MQAHSTPQLPTGVLRVACGGLVLLVLLLAPTPTQAEQTSSYNAHCKRITKQINHYEGVADMARERENNAWLAGTLSHLERLEARRDRLCPAFAQEVAAEENRQFWKDTYALTKQLAQGAVRYFTLGAY